MTRFLDEVKPRYIASMHQPLYGVGATDKDMRFVRRLAANLDLPVKTFAVCGTSCGASPTLTSWYNRKHAGVAVTVEYGR